MKTSLTSLILFSSIFLFAQNQKELGITTRNFENYGITYRFGKSNFINRLTSNFIRGNAVLIPGPNSNGSGFDFGIDLAYGKELRRPLGSKIDFRIGNDIGATYARHVEKTETFYPTLTETSYRSLHYFSPFVDLILGLNFKLTDQFLLGFELLPRFRYHYASMMNRNEENELTEQGESTEEESKASRHAFGFYVNSNTPRISFVCVL